MNRNLTSGGARRNRKGCGLFLALGIVAVIWGWFNVDEIQLRLFERGVERQVTRNEMAKLDPKALHVAFCGTGSPLPNKDRAAACTAVIAGGRVFVFDMGDGAGKNYALMGLPFDKIEGIWLTHLHSDHFEGLGPFALQRWVGANSKTPLTLSGPAGTDKIAQGITLAYEIDHGFRTAHHGQDIAPPEGGSIVGTVINPGVVYDRDGVKITAFPVNHAPVAPAFGYRLDWQGKSVTLSGDTAASPDLIAAAKNTDLLVHEVLSPRLVKLAEASLKRHNQPRRAKIMADIIDYHSSPEQAGDDATKAGAKALALSHIVPPLPQILDGLITRPAAAHYSGPLWMMRDGDMLSIEGAGKIEKSSLLR